MRKNGPILDQDFVKQELAYWNIPGVSYVICSGDAVLETDGCGYRDAERKLPMTADTLGGIASCSKAFTSAVIASLAEEGLLDYDRPVREYLPEFRMKDPAADAQCTVRDMLYHRTGLAPHDALWPDPEMSAEELIRRLRYLEPNRPFRSSAQYNNTMYALLGAVAAGISGKSWEELVQEKILEPLGMRRSCLTIAGMRSREDWAKGYFGRDRCAALEEMEPWEMDIAGPAAGVNTSAREMAAWLMLHLKNGVYQGRRLFSEEFMKEMHRPAMDISAFPWRFPEVPGIGWYGMAWKTTFYRDMQIIYHCGEIEGYCSIELFLPDRDFGMFVLCNRHKPQTPFLMELVYTAIDRYFDCQKIDWAARLHPYEKIFGGSCDDWAVNGMRGENVKGTLPSHALPEYIGVYENPGYGRLEIGGPEWGQTPETRGLTPFRTPPLTLHYKKWLLPLEHYHYDTFRVSGLKEDTLYYTLPLTFQTDPLTGQICSFTLPLEMTVPPILFSRRNHCRHAVEEDLPAVAGIYDRIHTEEENGRCTTGWKREIYPTAASARRALEAGDLFVMEADGRIAASARINRIQDPAYAKAAWTIPARDDEVMVLHTLTVDPKLAGKGIGSAFVRFYEEYARARGCSVLRMDTNAKNEAARALYRKLGYREADIVSCVFQGLEGIRLVCLEKEIMRSQLPDRA